MLRTLLPALLILTMGCHAKFKKAAPLIDTVDIRAYQTSSPHVSLGYVYTDPDDGAVVNLVGDIINTAQTIKGIQLEQVIAQAVDVQRVNTALANGLAEGLGSGPPFAYGGTESPALVQLEVTSYGMDVVTLGAPGEFTYNLKVSVYDPAGKRVYKHRTGCSTGVGTPKDVSQALWLVNNAKQLKEMPPEQIHAAFETVAYWCGTEAALKLRKHGG